MRSHAEGGLNFLPKASPYIPAFVRLSAFLGKLYQSGVVNCQLKDKSLKVCLLVLPKGSFFSLKYCIHLVELHGGLMQKVIERIAVISVALFLSCGSISSALALTLDQPSAVRMQDGQVVVDHVLRLRPQAELKKLFHAGHILRKSKRGVPVGNPDVTPEQRTRALKNAANRLAEATVFFDALPADAYQHQLEEAQQKRWSYLYRVGLKSSLDIVAAFGDSDDADDLLQNAVSLSGALHEERVRLLMKAAVAILVRSGADDRALQERIDRFTGQEDALVRPFFFMEAADYGSRAAYAYLLDEIAVKRNQAGWPETVAASAFYVLMSREHPEVLALALDFVKAYGAGLEKQLKGEKDSSQVIGLWVSRYATGAYSYAATFAPESERHHLNVGFIPAGNLVFLGRVFENPVGLADHYYGASRGEPYQVHRTWHQFTVCELLAARTPAEKERIADELLQLFFNWYRHFESRDHIAQRVPAYFIAAARAHCEIDQTAVGIYEWARDDGDILLPDYIRAAAFPAKDFLDRFVKEGDAGVRYLRMLDHYETVDVAPLGQTLSDAKTAEARAHIEHRELIAPPVNGQLNNQIRPDDQHAVMRRFNKASGAASQPVWLAMRTTLALRNLKNRYFIGVSLGTAIHADNPLAATISGDMDKLNAFVADSGRKIITRVQIRNQDTAVDVPYLQTTNTGQHIFEIDTADFRPGAVVDVFFDEALNLDPISLPVDGTKLAIDRRFQSPD